MGSAVGSIFVQIAKNIVGCKTVIGIAGGKEKCDWVKSLGADECIDYKVRLVSSCQQLKLTSRAETSRPTYERPSPTTQMSTLTMSVERLLISCFPSPSDTERSHVAVPSHVCPHLQSQYMS
jgi:D-arabinose 1-dehydrogenase-like Zn-dependent alcohol dehydrogenase